MENESEVKKSSYGGVRKHYAHATMQ